MTQSQLRLRHSVTSLAQTLDYIKVAYRRHEVDRILDRLTLKMIAHKAVTYITTTMNEVITHNSRWCGWHLMSCWVCDAHLCVVLLLAEVCDAWLWNTSGQFSCLLSLLSLLQGRSTRSGLGWTSNFDSRKYLVNNVILTFRFLQNSISAGALLSTPLGKLPQTPW